MQEDISRCWPRNLLNCIIFYAISVKHKSKCRVTSKHPKNFLLDLWEILKRRYRSSVVSTGCRQPISLSSLDIAHTKSKNGWWINWEKGYGWHYYGFAAVALADTTCSGTQEMGKGGKCWLRKRTTVSPRKFAARLGEVYCHRKSSSRAIQISGVECDAWTLDARTG